MNTSEAKETLLLYRGPIDGADSLVQGQEIVVKGEVLDMTCYIAHNLSGPQHAQCAKECIRKGLPVGIKGEDGKIYLLVGKKQPVNAELAFAG